MMNVIRRAFAIVAVLGFAFGATACTSPVAPDSEYDFGSTSYDFGSTSYDFGSTSYDFGSTS